MVHCPLCERELPTSASEAMPRHLDGIGVPCAGGGQAPADVLRHFMALQVQGVLDGDAGAPELRE